MKTSKVSGFLKFTESRKRKHLHEMHYSLCTYHLFHLIGGVIRKQPQGTRKKWRHGKEGCSARVYVHSRNLKIHKNFSYLKLSHKMYSSVLT